MKGFKVLSFFLVFTFVSNFTKAEVKLADIFSNHMVLQRNLKLKIWGTADAKEKVKVTFLGKSYRTKADNNGKWQVILKPMDAGGPFEMTVEGTNKLVLKDILIGDVWVCSGQSNMKWKLKRAKNAEEEINMANYPNIRFFSVPESVSDTPLNTIPTESWEVCSPQTATNFSAVGYFFGRDIHLEKNIPIGLINSNYGGTCVEAWTSKESFTKLDGYEKYKQKIENFSIEKEIVRKKEALKEKIGEFPQKAIGITSKWMLPETDKSNWLSIKLPAIWERVGFEDLDGLVWFSKDVNLDDNLNSKKATLHLGGIDDSDIVWVNGVKVGETNWGFNKKRVYHIPDDVLKKGKNNITIRVQDRQRPGGFRARPKDFALKIGTDKINLSGTWKLKVDEVYENFEVLPNELPSLLYNAMIHPLIPYGIRGVIWYQGENNAGRGKDYAITFPNLINNWRKDWNQGDFPFLFVQLANFGAPAKKPSNSNWAELRESQTKTLELKNTAMALAIDIGKAYDIHPKNKQDVGKRLALAARKVAYKEDIVFSGPKYKSVEFKGNKAYISFTHLGSGLMIKGTENEVKEFTIAGKNKQFYKANAKIEGNKIVVWANQVKNPTAVRFAWANNPAEFNLYNKEELPAIPFRTDNWPGITDGKTFDN
ncbi:sialate O-acetylesterase [Polaribacter sp.]|uniref:sialate O-acetylesterase n=1 Tax=Polaribacter sp. TaxID=1920175 RepID=UPI003F6D17BD